MRRRVRFRIIIEKEKQGKGPILERYQYALTTLFSLLTIIITIAFGWYQLDQGQQSINSAIELARKQSTQSQEHFEKTYKQFEDQLSLIRAELDDSVLHARIYTACVADLTVIINELENVQSILSEYQTSLFEVNLSCQETIRLDDFLNKPELCSSDSVKIGLSSNFKDVMERIRNLIQYEPPLRELGNYGFYSKREINEALENGLDADFLHLAEKYNQMSLASFFHHLNRINQLLMELGLYRSSDPYYARPKDQLNTTRTVIYKKFLEVKAECEFLNLRYSERLENDLNSAISLRRQIAELQNK